jgi:hypothetical protein
VSVSLFPFHIRYGAPAHRRFREEESRQDELLVNTLFTGRFVAVLVKKSKSFTMFCRISIRAAVMAQPSFP